MNINTQKFFKTLFKYIALILIIYIFLLLWIYIFDKFNSNKVCSTLKDWKVFCFDKNLND